MFLRVIQNGTHALYQCDSWSMTAVKDRPGCIMFALGRETQREAFVEVDKNLDGEVAVYVMNDLGRTIDTVFRKDK